MNKLLTLLTLLSCSLISLSSHAQTALSVYQAEDYTDASALDEDNRTSPTGVKFSNSGSWYTGSGFLKARRTLVEWNNVTVPTAGAYRIDLTYTSSAPIKYDTTLIANGVRGRAYARLPGDDSLTKPVSQPWFIRLKQGRNEIKLSISSFAEVYLDKLTVFPIGASKTQLKNSLTAIQRHLNGDITLNKTQFAERKRSIDATIGALTNADEDIVRLAFSIVQDYERIHGPVFLNSATRFAGQGWVRADQVPDIDTTVISIMEGIVDYIYQSPENIASLGNILDGFWFKSSEHFPGPVTATPDPDQVHKVRINASYTPQGRLIHGDEKPAIKPTGRYLAPGSIATLTVPRSMVGKGFNVRVGAHSQDHSKRQFLRRLDRVSTVYPIISTVTTLANPFGGGIYIETPYLAKEGIEQIRLQNVISSPYFSVQSFKTTTNSEWRNQQRNLGAPWADFKTEKFMVQVPSYWIYAVDDPAAIMRDWDLTMSMIADLVGLPDNRGKETLYRQTDVISKGSGGTVGYPQINGSYSAYQTRTKYDGEKPGFVKSPRQGSNLELHELGHGLSIPKLDVEKESVVNILDIAMLSRIYGGDLDTVLANDRYGGNDPYKTLANTAVTWMTTKNFLLENSMTKLEMQYQKKGHARYMELAMLFGWNVLSDYWQSISVDTENNVAVDLSHDGFTLRMSKNVGYDVSPLLQFWGMQPYNAAKLKADIASARLQPSTKIYDMLVKYRDLVPANNAAFRQHALSWWGKEPIGKDNSITLQDHDEFFETYNRSQSQQIKRIMQNNIEWHFPKGRPVLEGWVYCAGNLGSCNLESKSKVRFGFNGSYVQRTLPKGEFECISTTFGQASTGFSSGADAGFKNQCEVLVGPDNGDSLCVPIKTDNGNVAMICL